MNALLDNFRAVPIRDIIKFNQFGAVLVNGQELDAEQSIRIKQSAHALFDNQVRRLVQDQVTYNAINLGVHKGTSPETILFAKASLWVMQEEEKLVRALAQEDTPTS